MSRSKSFTVTQRWTARWGPFQEYEISLEIDSAHGNGQKADLVSKPILALINEVNEAVLRFEQGPTE